MDRAGRVVRYSPHHKARLHERTKWLDLYARSCRRLVDDLSDARIERGDLYVDSVKVAHTFDVEIHHPIATTHDTSSWCWIAADDGGQLRLTRGGTGACIGGREEEDKRQYDHAPEPEDWPTLSKDSFVPHVLHSCDLSILPRLLPDGY